MRNLKLAAAGVFCLFVANAAWGVNGTPIPLSASSATVRVVLAGDGSEEISGTLPLFVPFDLSGGSCAGNGTVTVSLTSGKIQVRAQGTLSGVGCTIIIYPKGIAIAFDVPHIGEPTTPVVFTVENTSSSLSGVDLDHAVWTTWDSFYQSELAAGTLTSGEIHSELLFPLDRSSAMLTMIPGDSVVLPRQFGTPEGTTAEIMFAATGGSGTFDETYQISASLPPEFESAAIPAHIAWLIGGVLTGLGIKLLRKTE